MNEKDRVYVEDGGSNLEIIHDDKDIYQDNPTWDFVTNKRHWLHCKKKRRIINPQYAFMTAK